MFATSTMTSETAVIMKSKVQTFSIPLHGFEDWIKINAGQKALARVAHSEEMTRRLGPAIRNKTLTAVDRAALLLDSYALAKAGFSSIESVVAVLRQFEDEDSYIVWNAISGIMMALYIQMEQVGHEAFDAYLAFGKTAVLKALNKVSWTAKPTDGHTDKLLRATVIGLLDTFAWNDPDVVKQAKYFFDNHWSDPSILPSEYRTTVYKIIVMNGGEAEYNTILKTFYATEDNSEKRFAFVIGSTHSKALKLRTLDWAVKSGDVKLQDFFYPIGPVANSAEGAELTWNYYKEVCTSILIRKLTRFIPLCIH
jgi:hypothetical protein